MTLLDIAARRPAPGLARDLAARLAAWNDARVTRRMLSRLTPRELDDIGLTPADIDRIGARR